MNGYIYLCASPTFITFSLCPVKHNFEASELSNKYQ